MPLPSPSPDRSLFLNMDRQRSFILLEAAIPALCASETLPLGDLLSLSRTCRALRVAVKAAWRPPRLAALMLASLSSRVVLLDPFTGRVLQGASACPPLSEEDEQAGLGSWPPCLEVDVAGSRCFITQYEGSCVLEYSLPQLHLQRRICCRQLAGAPVREPEGVVFAHECIYVAWLYDMCITATPLEVLDAPTVPATSGAAAAAAAGTLPGVAVMAAAIPAASAQHLQQQQHRAQPQAPAQAPVQLPPLGGRQRQRALRRAPGQAQWIFWGLRLGPDNALYVACNPPYPSEGCYGAMPEEAGRGFVARLRLDEEGQLRGNMARFTQGSLLSRPSGLCFDDAGDLYVTHMGCQVVKYGGPHRGQAAGQPMGVFIDCLRQEHALTPDPQAFRPCPVDICFHQGLFFLTTHTTKEEEPTYGCLSTWGRQGELLAATMLGEDWRHPNSVAIIPAPTAA